jgi:hypothetical protein
MNRKNYTKDQLEILDRHARTRVEVLDDLLREARRTFDTVVPLPFQNELGESVLHGCNKDMLVRANELLEAAQPLWRNIPETEQKYLRERWLVDPGKLKDIKGN